MRPHTRHGWRDTNLRCSLSRKRMVFAARRVRREPAAAAEGRGSNYAIGFTSLRLVIGQDRLRRRPTVILPSFGLPFSRFLVAKRHDLCAEACLDQLGVRSRKGILGGQAALCRTGRLIG